MDQILRDLLFSLRAMRRNPTFAITAILILALGIGGNTAMFTIIRHVLLKPLEYREPDRLVYFSLDNVQRMVRDGSFGLPRLQELRKSAQSFTAVGAFLHSREEMTLSGVGDPEPLKGARVSANFLDLLGVRPLIGRGFIDSEDVHGAAPVVMIGESLWRRRFGADPAIAGKIATLDSVTCAIVGVLPAGFDFPMTGVDVWVPRPSEWSILPARYWSGITVLNGFARLRPGVTLEQAQAEMDVLNRQYAAAHPNPFERDAAMRLMRLQDRLVSNVRAMLWTLAGALGFVLLIACANVAGLLMARASARSREFALRASLGAPRSRLIGQLLVESAVLAGLGGILGLVLAYWGLGSIKLADAVAMSSPVMPLALPGAGEIRLDGAVLLFTLALSLITGIVFGLAPALGASRPDVAEALRASGEGAGLALRRSMLPRGALVMTQIAMTMVLLIGAALLIRSFARLRGVDPGFAADHLLTMKVALPAARYDTEQKRAAFFSDAVARMETLPGVRGAAMAMTLPTTTWIRTNVFGVEGRAPVDDNDPSSFAVLQSVTPDYFRTLGLKLQHGREFEARDDAPGAAPVIIVNETLARRLWPAADPVGLHMGEGYDKKAGRMEIVGVVADVREGGLASEHVAEFYVTAAVHPPQTAYLILRTGGDPRGFANAARAQVLAIDRDQAVSDVRSMEDVLDASMGQRRLAMRLLGTFAAVALLLAVVGIYGVIAYSVAQRTREMGIRRALGAQQSDILRLVLSQTLGLTVGGVVIGITGALALTGLMKNLLFGITATDPATYVGIGIAFVVVGLAAGWLPARRAVQVDPMAVLR
jgi:putative ABC transport system permease protein